MIKKILLFIFLIIVVFYVIKMLSIKEDNIIPCDGRIEFICGEDGCTHLCIKTPLLLIDNNERIHSQR